MQSSHHPLRFYPTFEGVLARARTMNHHPHGRMKVLWAWLEAMEGVDGAMGSLRMYEKRWVWRTVLGCSNGAVEPRLHV
ncbi:hypothetical protein PIB30_084684 [Stylosanthes scabra]|uniref:Uncharacterized protein n=1 Tax=Stylosanthes scabra TaxID=79078 RepID=A0ABU6RT35_9FABA|nr:hypothetical protein [Stylosanthes scabra]